MSASSFGGGSGGNSLPAAGDGQPVDPTRAGTDAPAVDLQQLRSVWRVGRFSAEYFNETVELFLSEAAKRLQQVGDALATGLAGEAGRHAHGLRGSAALFGAQRLVGLCTELERCGDAGDLAGAQAVYHLLPGALAAVQEALRAAAA